MKNSSLIIKIAFGVSAAAALFSIVTLIRAIILHVHLVLPIIQVVGSAAIFGICFLMFRALSGSSDEEEGSAENTDSGEQEEKDAFSDAEQAAKELEKKYHLSDFEEKPGKEELSSDAEEK